MIARSKNAIVGYPCYRLTGGSSGEFQVIRFVGYENAKQKNRTTYYGEETEFPEAVAVTTSREAALAVMRLYDVKEYEDWTT